MNEITDVKSEGQHLRNRKTRLPSSLLLDPLFSVGLSTLYSLHTDEKTFKFLPRNHFQTSSFLLIGLYFVKLSKTYFFSFNIPLD